MHYLYAYLALAFAVGGWFCLPNWWVNVAEKPRNQPFQRNVVRLRKNHRKPLA